MLHKKFGILLAMGLALGLSGCLTFLEGLAGGGSSQSWQWLVVDDAKAKQRIAEYAAADNKVKAGSLTVTKYDKDTRSRSVLNNLKKEANGEATARLIFGAGTIDALKGGGVYCAFLVEGQSAAQYWVIQVTYDGATRALTLDYLN